MTGQKNSLIPGIMFLLIFSFLIISCSSGPEIKRENKKENKASVKEKGEKENSGAKPVKKEDSSSSRIKDNKPDEKLKDIPPPEIPLKKIINLEKAYREKIKKSNISEITKVTYDMLHTGKLINRKKLSSEYFNNEGFLIRKIMYDNNDSLKYFFEYVYAKNGDRIRTDRYDADSNLVNYYSYLYDEYGNKTKVICYDENDRKINHYIYKYNNDGKLIEYIWYDWLGKIDYIVKYKYDKKGRTSDVNNYLPGNKLISKYQLLYDKNDLLIEEMQFTADGMKTGIIQYIYKYENTSNQ